MFICLPIVICSSVQVPVSRWKGNFCALLPHLASVYLCQLPGKVLCTCGVGGLDWVVTFLDGLSMFQLYGAYGHAKWMRPSPISSPPMRLLLLSESNHSSRTESCCRCSFLHVHTCHSELIHATCRTTMQRSFGAYSAFSAFSAFCFEML